MEWFLVLTLIVLGIGLIVIEIIFVPGTTVVGIVGLLSLIAGNYFAFEYFSTLTASAILGLSLTGGAITTVIAFKSGTWNRFSLKGVNTSRVNLGPEDQLQIEQRGVALSALRPFGKAEFDNKIYEVRSAGNYVKQGEKIRIILLDGPKIYVEPINE
jgi:membrane-bound ClpP family serine protease